MRNVSRKKDLEFIDCFFIFDVGGARTVIEDDVKCALHGKKEMKTIGERLTRKERKINYLQTLDEWENVKTELKIELTSNDNLKKSEVWNDEYIESDNLDSEFKHHHILLIYDAANQRQINSAEKERTFTSMTDVETTKRNGLSSINLHELASLVKSGRKGWTTIPFRKCISHFNNERSSNEQKKFSTFNQNISFALREQMQFDDTKHLS